MKTSAAIAMQVMLLMPGLSRTGAEAQTQKAGTPYTIEYHELSLNMSTGKVMEFRRTRAQRSDGSTVSVTWSRFPGDDRLYANKTIRLAPERKTLHVGEQVEAVSTLFWAPAASAPDFDLPNPVSDLRSLSMEKMLGFDVVKAFREDGRVRVTRWYAPSLRDLMFREVWEWKDEKGVVFAKTEKAALSILLEEPRADLFTVPAHYVEMPPSAAAELTQLKYFNRPLDSDKAAILDREYIRALRYRP